MSAGSASAVIPTSRAKVVTVIAAGVAPGELGAVLTGLTTEDSIRWRVYGGMSLVQIVDIAVCPYTLCRTLARRFRSAMIVAVAPGPQPSAAVDRAYEDGATVFVEKLEVGMVAAQIVAAARRGGLFEQRHRR